MVTNLTVVVVVTAVVVPVVTGGSGSTGVIASSRLRGTMGVDSLSATRFMCGKVTRGCGSSGPRGRGCGVGCSTSMGINVGVGSVSFGVSGSGGAVAPVLPRVGVGSVSISRDSLDCVPGGPSVRLGRVLSYYRVSTRGRTSGASRLCSATGRGLRAIIRTLLGPVASAGNCGVG